MNRPLVFHRRSRRLLTCTRSTRLSLSPHSRYTHEHNLQSPPPPFLQQLQPSSSSSSATSLYLPPPPAKSFQTFTRDASGALLWHSARRRTDGRSFQRGKKNLRGTGFSDEICTLTLDVYWEQDIKCRCNRTNMNFREAFENPAIALSSVHNTHLSPDTAAAASVGWMDGGE